MSARLDKGIADAFCGMVRGWGDTLASVEAEMGAHRILPTNIRRGWKSNSLPEKALLVKQLRYCLSTEMGGYRTARVCRREWGIRYKAMVAHNRRLHGHVVQGVGFERVAV